MGGIAGKVSTGEQARARLVEPLWELMVDRGSIATGPAIARPGTAPQRDSIVVSAETAYPSRVAGARVRIASFAPHLAPYGIDLRYRPTLTDREYEVISSTDGPQASIARRGAALGRGAWRAVRMESKADLQLVHRLRSLTPLPGEALRRLDVYDFDDALFVGWTRRLAWLKREQARCRTYISRARLVIAGNTYLAGAARAWATNVEVVPSCVDPSMQPVRQHAEREVLRVGWVGSSSTGVFVNAVMPVFERLNANGVRASLVLIGGAEELDAPWIEHRRWSPETVWDEVAEFDIGIMPMPDNEWTRGKCGYKLLQYFAAGIPAVASPVGVNRNIVGDERGRLATTEDEWVEALEELISDVGARREMGDSARQFVQREYSYQRWAPELAELLRQL